MMTDETREQIKRDAEDYAHQPGHVDTISQCVDHFSKGAIHGYNKAIDDVLSELRFVKSCFEFYDDFNDFKKELEKLKQ